MKYYLWRVEKDSVLCHMDDAPLSSTCHLFSRTTGKNGDGGTTWLRVSHAINANPTDNSWEANCAREQLIPVDENDPILLEICERNGYTGPFAPIPSQSRECLPAILMMHSGLKSRGGFRYG